MAEVQQVRESPVSAVSSEIAGIFPVIVREERGRNVEILYVIYFVPFQFIDRQGFKRGVVQQCQNPQHLLIVFIVAHHLAVCIQERHILVPAELFAEFVDVHRFPVRVDVLVAECLLRDEIHDVPVLVYADHGPVHPAFVFCDQRQVLVRMVYEQVNDFLVEYQVGFQQNRVLSAKCIFCKRQ